MSKILYNNKNIEVSYLSFSRKKTKSFVFTKDQLRSIVLPPFGKFLVARHCEQSFIFLCKVLYA